MHLHANVVRFERTPFQQSQPPPPTRPGKIAPSFVSAVKGILPTPVLSPPAMVLDDSCMIIVKGKSFVVRAKELFVWSPSFVEVIEADDTHEEGEFIQNGEEGFTPDNPDTDVGEPVAQKDQF
nr:hypothetical protein [Tanacetum cinerariifolium]